MILEMRTYRLKPGMGDRFVAVMATVVEPVLRGFDMTMLDYGSARLGDETDCEGFVLRSFDSLEHRNHCGRVLYDSREWTHGPRAEFMALSDSSRTMVIDTVADRVRMMRAMN